jgi:hypothetical protein
VRGEAGARDGEGGRTESNQEFVGFCRSSPSSPGQSVGESVGHGAGSDQKKDSPENFEKHFV